MPISSIGRASQRCEDVVRIQYWQKGIAKNKFFLERKKNNGRQLLLFQINKLPVIDAYGEWSDCKSDSIADK